MKWIRFCISSLLLISCSFLSAQSTSDAPQWIRPDSPKDPAMWGIRNGIVVSLWPTPLEQTRQGSEGGPRGLLRIGYEYLGSIYHINYIAVEPVVKGKMEFSEISPSQVDGKWGKLMWAGDTSVAGRFSPSANTRGKISHPIPGRPEIEELSFYIFMEHFINGAHPYLKVSIRSDRPEEVGLQIFHHNGSAEMERCVVTATMGNYSRLRLLHLKDEVIDSRILYKGYSDVGFIDKPTYPHTKMMRDKGNNFIVIAEPNETFNELSSWPQEQAYLSRWNWRYRPFYKLTQYWRKESAQFNPSLSVKVNGRATYWSGGTANKTRYVPIPGGPSFENFELREKYYAGQTFYFGMTRMTAQELKKKWTGND